MSHPAALLTSDDEVRDLLRSVKSIALIGASPKPWRDSNGIMAMLLDAGYDVVPVNPNYPSVHGRRCFPDLASLPSRVDLVNVFRNPAGLRPLVDEVVRESLGVVWFQPGASDEDGVRYALRAGVRVVADRCIAVDHRRLRHGSAVRERRA